MYLFLYLGSRAFFLNFLEAKKTAAFFSPHIHIYSFVHHPPSVGGPLWEEEKGRTRARDERRGRGLVFDEGGSVGHTSVHFLLLKLFGFSDNLLKFMEKK